MNNLSLIFLGVFFVTCAYSEQNVTKDVVFGKSPVGFKTISHAKQDESIRKISNPVKTKNPHLGYVYLDYLYWAGKRTGMSYEVENYYYTPPSKWGDRKTVNPEWCSGFKIDMGFSNIFDWMVSGIFTYYKNRLHDRQKFSTTHVSIKTLGYVSSSETNFHLIYWTADLDFGTLFQLSSSAALKPFITARGAHFHYYSQYQAENFSDISDPTVDESINLQAPFTFTGLGPRVGFNLICRCGNTGLNFLGLLSTSLVYGKVKYEDNYLQTTFYNQRTNYLNVKGRFKDLKANLQLLLGAEWKAVFDHEKKAILLRVLWENNYWWDQVNYFNQNELHVFKSLVLYGANFGMGFEY